MSTSQLRRRPDAGLLQRLLEDPALAPALRGLPASALRQVILRVGLEDAGELIALASLEQLREVFDEDLWRSARPGQDEAFDAARFGAWLEVLLEGGEAFVADRLAGLSEDFLVFALSQQLHVLDLAILTIWASDPQEAERLDRIVDAHFCQELDAYLLVSRSERGWDALLATLLALDERHPRLLRAVLGRCAEATHEEIPSAGGLDAALAGDERLLEDARAERETRRAARGYVSPADARAFLALARSAPEDPEEDPITRAHFRELAPSIEPGPGASPAAGGQRPDALRRLLLEAGAGLDAPAPPPAATGLLRQALGELLESDPRAHQRVIEELAYLANVLLAGDTSAARPWRPVEAAERVLELCEEGLCSRAESAAPEAAGEALARWGAAGLFRLAWAARSGTA